MAKKKLDKSPAFQLYPKEWLACSTVMRMTPRQEGGYIRLICLDWQDDGILDDRTVIAYLSRLNDDELDLLLGKFIAHPKKADYLTHPRVQKERRKQKENRRKKSASGKKGAEKRWSKDPQTPDNQGAYEASKGDGDANGDAKKVPLANDGSSIAITSTATIAIDKENKKKGRKLPTLAEWLDYAKERGYPSDDAESAFDHYEANGWKQSKGNLIKSWKAALRTCHGFYKNRNPQQNTNDDQSRLNF